MEYYNSFGIYNFIEKNTHIKNREKTIRLDNKGLVTRFRVDAFLACQCTARACFVASETGRTSAVFRKRTRRFRPNNGDTKYNIYSKSEIALRVIRYLRGKDSNYYYINNVANKRHRTRR